MNCCVPTLVKVFSVRTFITFQGTVRIDGKFKGEIVSSDVLVVGESAEVRAEISVGTVIINGKVWGDVRATESVQLHAPAQLRGNIFTPSLTIDEGVLFEGKCQMENLGELITKSSATGFVSGRVEPAAEESQGGTD